MWKSSRLRCVAARAFVTLGLLAVVAGSLRARQADAKRSAPARTAMPTMAFVDVAVIPMDRERVLSHQTVVVRGGRIVALGLARRVPVPAAARRIDGRGKYLIPGLADMHAHIGPLGDEDTTVASLERWLYAYAANGVTTIRTMGFAPTGPRILTARARAARGDLVSPRIYAAAGPLSIGSAADVALAKDSGYDLVKLYGLDGPQLDSVAATAHRLGIPIAGHPPSFATSPTTLQRAITAGFASVEHLAGFEPYLGSRGFWWEFWNDSTRSPAQARQLLADTAKLRAIVADFQRAGVWNCPTLAMYDATLLPEAATWPELRYLRPVIAQELRAKHDSFPRLSRRPTAQAAVEVRRAITKMLRDGGVGLLLGTDTPVPYMVPGFSVHRELEAFVRAGLTPYEALATGTRNVAAYFNTLDSTGTIAIGKRADLVLLNGNPLQDIRHTTTPAGVMLGGRWLDRAALDHGLAAVKGQLWGFPPQS